MDRRRVGFAGLALVGLLTLSTACSSSSDPSSSGDGQASETPPGGATATSTPRQFQESDCVAVVAAFANVESALVDAPSGLDQTRKQELEDDLGDLQSLMPADLADDLTVISTGFQVYFSVTEGLPGSDPAVVTASQQLGAPEVVAARDTVKGFLAETCPSDTPS